MEGLIKQFKEKFRPNPTWIRASGWLARLPRGMRARAWETKCRNGVGAGAIEQEENPWVWLWGIGADSETWWLLFPGQRAKGNGGKVNKSPLPLYIRKMEQNQKHGLVADEGNAQCMCRVSLTTHTHKWLEEVRYPISFMPNVFGPQGVCSWSWYTFHRTLLHQHCDC